MSSNGFLTHLVTVCNSCLVADFIIYDVVLVDNILCNLNLSYMETQGPFGKGEHLAEVGDLLWLLH